MFHTYYRTGAELVQKGTSDFRKGQARIKVYINVNISCLKS